MLRDMLRMNGYRAGRRQVANLFAARDAAETSRQEYSEVRPHSALDYRTPREAANDLRYWRNSIAHWADAGPQVPSKSIIRAAAMQTRL